MGMTVEWKYGNGNVGVKCGSVTVEMEVWKNVTEVWEWGCWNGSMEMKM